MAPIKNKKPQRRATKASLDDSDMDNAAVAASAGRKARSDDWDTWQDAARAQEADRVRQYMGTFQAQVARARSEALDRLRGAEARSKSNDAAFLARLRAAWDGPEVAHSVDQHPLHATSREVMDLLQALLTRFDTASGELEAAQASCSPAGGSEVAAWANDCVEARKLLGYGRIYGDRLVHDIIVPNRATTMTDALGEGSKDLNDTGRSAIGLFPRSRAALAGGGTWGETARAQMQALAGLAQTENGTERKTVSFADC